MFKKLIIVLTIVLASVCNGQVSNWSGLTVEQLSAITVGVTNIASKVYWETYAYQQIKDLMDYNSVQSTLTVNSATPSVASYSRFLTANTSTTAITNLTTPSVVGGQIYIEIGDANTTFIHSTNFDCGGINLAPTTGDVIVAFYDGAKWRVKFHFIGS